MPWSEVEVLLEMMTMRADEQAPDSARPAAGSAMARLQARGL